MRIDEIRVENFRCFDRYALRLSPRFNLLIGDNGCGKTALLDALAVAAEAFLLGIPTDYTKLRNIREDDVRIIGLKLGATALKEYSGVTLVKGLWEWDTNPNPHSASKIEEQHQALSSTLSSFSYQWTRWRQGGVNRTTVNQDNKLQEAMESLARMAIDPATASETDLPLIGYYGTGRLWQVVSETQKMPWGAGSRFRGYIECLNPALDLRTLFRWFESNERAAIQKVERRGVLEAVRDAITSMIPGAEKLWWDFDWDELMLEIRIKDEVKTVPFHHLK